MNVQNLTLPFGIDNGMNSGTGLDPASAAGTGQVFTGTNWGDRIRPAWPPGRSQQFDGLSGGLAGASSPPLSFGSMLSQLMSMLSQVLSALGLGSGTTNAGGQMQSPYANGETQFTSAQGSSTGDPHLNFNGTTNSGTSISAQYDSMNAHSDLLDSDSFGGGYRLSTMTTAPNSQGLSWNRKAVVTTDDGATKVSLENDGDARVMQNGNMTQLQAGQNLNLGNGESVSYNADGSLVVNDMTAAGGTIATTLRKNGQGVDVSMKASNVDLGGDLVNHA